MGILEKLVNGRVGVDVEESRKGEVRRVVEEGFGSAAVAFEIGPEDSFEDFGEGAGGPADSEGSNSEVTGAPPGGWMVWGQLQAEILDAIILDEEHEGEGQPALESLARRLRSSLEDFEMIIRMTNPQEFSAKRLERLLQLERIRNRDASWDSVEDGALRKLALMLEGRNLKLAEVLAIANTANRASRTRGGGQMAPTSVTNIQVNGNGSPSVELPGPGGLGTMRLTLSKKTVNQLGQGITIDVEPEKYTDSIEMLEGKDVPLISKMADES